MSIWKRLFGKKNQGDKTPPPGQPAATPPPAATTSPALSSPLPNHPPANNTASSTAKPGPQSAATKDRVVRVFISSTFRDMVEDRNELMSHVWQALRKICRERAVEFVEVDLRWGVTEEQSQRKETLRHCLAEIKRCRPFFIGLLGERYGWVPGSEAYSPALLDEEDWLKSEVAKRSVTELEILHGVLNDPDMAGRSFFYCRDPKYAQAHGSDYQAENDDEAHRQTTLKQQVRSVCEAKHIPMREDYADPRALAELVLNDLTTAIDIEFPPDEVPDVWERENRDHEAFAKSRRTEFYVGRDAYFDRLDAFARDGAKGCGLTVLGESGGGKSALLANWVARWRQANPDDFIFQHYIGSSPMSVGHLALMRRLMVAIIRWSGDEGAPGSQEEERIPADAEEIVKVFPEYLDRLAVQAKQKGVSAVIVFDALNQLEDRERGRLLAWLPYRLPGEIRLVVSTLPGDTLNALQSREWPDLTVEPLTAEERVQLIARYLAHFSQGLSDARAKKIANVAAASNPLYLKTLLDDLRATGAHDRLDAQIADYLQADDIPALLGKILGRYERDYERDRPELVREALALLWAARRGLTEPELLEVLKPAGQERLPAALWSPVRCALEDGLVDRDGVLAFAHEYLRVAIERRYVADASKALVLRLQLADYFTGRPVDARQVDELPWLLRQVESRDRLRACLLDIHRFLLIQIRDEDELRGYWIWLHEERTMDNAYLESFEQWSTQQGLEDRYIAIAANQLFLFLHKASLYTNAEPLIRRSLTIDEQSYGKDHPKVATDLNNLAALFMVTNRFAAAEPLIRHALKIDEQNYGKDHLTVARDLNNLAVLLKDTNRFEEAELLMQRALTINEQSYGKNNPLVATYLHNLAVLLQATNRLEDAEPLMRRVLTIDEQSYGKDHPNVARHLSDLGLLLKDTNRLEEAELLMQRALTINEQSYGKDHPEVATNLSSLALLLQATNRLEEAEPLIRRALTIDEQSYNKDHPKVAIRLNNLAVLLQATNRLDEAEPLMRRALKIDEKSFGENHPNVAIDLNNLAALLKATNRLAEAEPLMRRALTINEQSYNKDHPEVATNLSSLALLLKDTNRLEEAEPLMRRALTINEQSYGNDHPKVAIRLNNLAVLLQATNRLEEAEALMRRALMIDEQSYGKDHPEVATNLHNLAQLLQATNRLSDAEPLNRRIVEIFCQLTHEMGHPHPDLQAEVNNYVYLLQAMGRSAEEIQTTLEKLGRRFGVNLVGAGVQELSPKLLAVIEQMTRDPSKVQANFEKIQRDDPPLFMELLQWVQSQQQK